MDKKTTIFLKNIGNGKSLPEIERENEEIDEYLFPQEVDVENDNNK